MSHAQLNRSGINVIQDGEIIHSPCKFQLAKDCFSAERHFDGLVGECMVLSFSITSHQLLSFRHPVC